MTEEVKNTRSKKYEIDNIKVEINEEIDDEEEQSKSPFGKIILIIGALFIIFFIYAFHIGPTLLTVKEYKVSSNLLPDSFNGIKIVQFSDIHYGTTINKKQLDKIVNKINETKPDIIFFTGDLIDKNIIPTDDIQREIIESLKNLKASLYKYAVLGNEDDDEIYSKIIEKAGFTILKNKSELLYYKSKTPIVITGFNNIESNPDYAITNEKIDDLNPSTLYHIVLFHESNAFENIKEYNPSLVLSSGTLGGKIKIIKPLLLTKTTDKYFEDYYRIDNTDFYISNGLGTSGINLRVNNNPSFNLYRLYKEEN